MSKTIWKNLGIITDSVLLSLTIGIFGISLFTVINLTAAYEIPDTSTRILGVETQYTDEKGLAFKNISKGETPLKNLTLFDIGTTKVISLDIDKFEAGYYYLPLARILNNKNKTTSIKISLSKNELPKETNLVLVLNDQEYFIDQPLPSFELKPKKSLDIGIYISSDSNVNFVSEVGILVE